MKFLNTALSTLALFLPATAQAGDSAIHLRDTTAQAEDSTLHLRGLKGMSMGMGMGMMGTTMTPKSMTSKTTSPAMSMTMGKKTETPTTQPNPAPTAPPFEEIGPTCTPCTDGSTDPGLCFAFNNAGLKEAVDFYTEDATGKAGIVEIYGPIECW